MTKGNPEATHDAVVLERAFDAPVEQIWQMWTEPAHVEEWYGPEGASVSVVELDVRIGGRRLLSMTVDTPAGVREMWFVGEFLEVIENRRLVYTDSMADANGTVLSPDAIGMPSGHPMTTQVRVELEPVDGRTRMVMTHAGIPADSPGAVGWAMAFDKLAALVA